MSYTTIKAVWPGEKHEDLEELRNSHGSAPVVWGEMAARYIPDCGGNRFAYSFHDEKLWPLWKRMDIPKHQRAVLTMTYDNTYVLKCDYARAAADIRAWLADFPQPGEYANHWPRIAELFESNPDIPAIAFHWTSVCEDPYQGEYDEETEEYGPPDWPRYWGMYEQLDALDRPTAQGAGDL